MTAIEELYIAAKALDDRATINDPLHTLSEYTVAYAQMGPLMRALRRYEREVNARDGTNWKTV